MRLRAARAGRIHSSAIPYVTTCRPSLSLLPARHYLRGGKRHAATMHLMMMQAVLGSAVQSQPRPPAHTRVRRQQQNHAATHAQQPLGRQLRRKCGAAMRLPAPHLPHVEGRGKEATSLEACNADWQVLLQPAAGGAPSRRAACVAGAADKRLPNCANADAPQANHLPWGGLNGYSASRRCK